MLYGEDSCGGVLVLAAAISLTSGLDKGDGLFVRRTASAEATILVGASICDAIGRFVCVNVDGRPSCRTFVATPCSAKVLDISCVAGEAEGTVCELLTPASILLPEVGIFRYRLGRSATSVATGVEGSESSSCERETGCIDVLTPNCFGLYWNCPSLVVPKTPDAVTPSNGESFWAFCVEDAFTSSGV